MPIVVGDDPRACADPIRWYAALYVGGMGSREKNFYNQLACRMGFDEAAARGPGPVPGPQVRRGRRRGARTSSSTQTSLLGPKERIAERMQVLAPAGVTTLTLSPFAGTPGRAQGHLRTAVEALELSGVGG